MTGDTFAPGINNLLHKSIISTEELPYGFCSFSLTKASHLGKKLSLHLLLRVRCSNRINNTQKKVIAELFQDKVLQSFKMCTS